MIGFENYSPISWLADKVLAVHVGVPVSKRIDKFVFRKGNWSSIRIGKVASALAIATSCVVLAVPTSIAGGVHKSSVVHDQDKVIDRFADAPPMYYESLTALVRKMPRLTAQSLAFDPPALV